jgi:hypothetical protein
MRHYRGKGKSSSKGESDYESDDEYKKDDRMYHVGTVNQVADYEKTTAFHLTKLQTKLTESKEIIKALRDLTECDLSKLEPVLRTTKSTNTAEVQAAETKQFDFMYKAEFQAHLVLKRTYASNKDKAYAHLWMHCTEEMQSKVKSRANFSTTILDNPIDLLKAVKELALNYQTNRPEVDIYNDANRATNLKQTEEVLVDYMARAKSIKDMFEEVNEGPQFLRRIVKKDPLYDETNPAVVEECIERASEQWWANNFINGANPERY